ncbi:MAG: glycosyltransferase [Cyanobacteria bacterium J06638_28]
MKFSVVIATYNRVDLLKRAIASALNQTIPCEVVVVDNASTDGTEDYARSLGDQIIYHRNPTNANHAGAINVGAKVATGEWIKFVDDDDYIAANCLEVMQAAIACHPEAVICSCQASQVDLEGQELSRTPMCGPGEAFYIPQDAVHLGMFLEQVPFGTPVQVAVRRDILLTSGGWDASMTSCVEIDSWIRIAEHGDALFINQCLAYRTIWPGGYDQHIDLIRRKDVNFEIKERIYKRISPKYRNQVPSLTAIRNYLDLHWGFVALKQRKLKTVASMCFPATFSPQAWKLLRQASAFRNHVSETALVPKIPLAL